MTAVQDRPAPPSSASRAPRPSLLRAEARRLRSRRFVQVLLALALLGFLLAVSSAAVTSFGRSSPELVAAAERERDRVVVEQEGFRQECLAAELPTDAPPETFCGEAVTADSLPLDQFLPKQPFVVERYVPDGALVVGVATAAVAFLLGATSVGAEWSSRSMVALLFWEPRRLRVIGAKVAVVAAACALLSVTAQLLWWGTGTLMGRFLGTTGPLPDGWVADLLGLQARAGLLVVLAGLLGFAISNLARGTGAALGVGFVYFAVVETAVRAVRPQAQRYLLTESAGALVQEGGQRIYLYDQRTQETVEQVVGNLEGGLVLTVATAVLLAAGALLFARRDLH